MSHTHKLSDYRDPRRKIEKGTESTFEEIIAENFANFGNITDTQVEETKFQAR